MSFNLLGQRPPDLDSLRNVLIRLEDSIIFALIERAQFSRNAKVYEPGSFEFNNGNAKRESFLDYFLHEVEAVHAKVRRYTSPDEYPFTSPLPTPILPPLPYPEYLAPNTINVNDDIMKMYLNELLPALCPDATKDDLNYGSAATKDVELLQVLSKRIHMGKFIAEAKFRETSTRAQYIALIKARDAPGLEALLTNRRVEEILLKRLRRKATIYGSDLNGDVNDLGHDIEPGNEKARSLKIEPNEVARLYEKFVIPLTKVVEVQYLLKRLDWDHEI